MGFLAGNAQHIGARHSQQDSFGFTDPDDQDFTRHAGFLAIVCDGMGGMEYGDAASRTAVRAFLDAYLRKPADETIPAALERSVIEANEQVLALAASLGLVEGIGTTLAAAVLHEQVMFYISVGDSGIFYVGGGEMRMINRPHIFANVLDAAVARGNLSAEDAATHPERESLTSYIGAQRLQEIDRNMDPLPLGDEAAIVLASDGLFKTLTVEEMRACCTGSPQTWPETLVERTIAQKREYQDNVTVLSIATTSGRTFRPPEAIPTRRTEEAAGDLPRTVRNPPAATSTPQPPAAVAWTLPAQLPQAVAGKPRGVLLPLVVAALVIAAAVAAWYVYERKNSHRMERIDPGGAVQSPRRDPMPPRPAPDPKDVQPAPKEIK